MPPVHKLPEKTSHLLKCGQIVTSVSSIVKEVVENALDAGATIIDVKLENSGIDKIEVHDNGCGIKQEDLPLVVLPYFTSKISSHEDLVKLSTYGFRGEALSAVCSVGSLTIVTKTALEDIGNSYTFDSFGNVTSKKRVPHNKGTSIFVEKLFESVPVRRKYYDTQKHKKEEINNIKDILMVFSMIWPEVKFTLYHSKSLIWNKNSVSSQKEALSLVLGSCVLSSMDHIQRTDDDNKVNLEIHVPKASSITTNNMQQICRASPDRTYVVVNRRPIKMKDITKLLQKYFCNAAKLHGNKMRFPVCLVSVTVPSENLDVNLEPNKTAVLFTSKDAVLNLLEDTLAETYGSLDESQSNSVVDIQVGQKVNNAIVQEEDSEAKKQSSLRNSASNCLKTENASKNCPDGSFLYETNNTSTNGLKHGIKEGDEIISCNGSSDEPRGLQIIFETLPHSSKAVSSESILSNTSFEEISDKSFLEEPPPSPAKMEQKTPSTSLVQKMPVWSMGLLSDDKGKLLQPVRILAPGKRSSENYDSQSTPSVPKKKKAIQNSVGQTKLFDLVGRSFVKRPMSSYEIFCSQEKEKVIAKNPSTDLLTLTQVLDERWKNLPQEVKSDYDSKAKKAQEKNEKLLEKSDGNLSNKPVPKKSFSRPSVELEFDLEIVRKKSKEVTHYSQGAELKNGLIGQTPTSGSWFMLKDGVIKAVNHFRIQETFLYDSLMKSYEMPVKIVNPPLIVYERDIGNSLLWEIMFTLKKESQDCSGNLYITDERLVANGFVIKILPDCSSSHVEISQLADCLSCYGAEDLKEILAKLVKEGTNLPLSKCRPSKVVHYLQGEAVRMVRKKPNKIDWREMEDLINSAGELNSEECIHFWPFYHNLFDMSELPATQA